jgi:type II secretory pathway pseudopilin PulG
VRRNDFNKNKYPAFTALEIMITLLVIVVLLGLAGYGVFIAMQSSRDSQRREMVRNLDNAIRAHEDIVGWYPTTNMLSAGVNTILVGAGDGYPGASRLQARDVLTPGTDTTNNTTLYCYTELENGGFRLGALLENGEWFYQDLIFVEADQEAECQIIMPPETGNIANN